MELRPDIFAGALMGAGGGAGEIAVHNAKLDALWTLQQLAGIPLHLVGFAGQSDAMAENGRIQAAVQQLRATPLGRARLALAAAFEQFPTWTSGDEPPAAGDHEAELDQIANAFAFANPAQVRYGVEVIAGGNFSCNHGVDYADLLSPSGVGAGHGAVSESGREPGGLICRRWRRRRGSAPRPPRLRPWKRRRLTAVRLPGR